MLIRLYLLLLFLFSTFYIKLNQSYTLELDKRITYYSFKKVQTLFNKEILNKFSEIDNQRNYEFSSLYSLSNDLALYWKNRYQELFSEFKTFSNVHNLNTPKYAKPTSYNFSIFVKDLVPMERDYQSYIKVYIDRQFFSDSSHGLRSQFKNVKLNLKTEKKLLLKVEKYVFNPFKKTWERELNLYQPRKKYIKIPKNRILIYEIIYDSSKEKPETANLKYIYTSYFSIND